MKQRHLPCTSCAPPVHRRSAALGLAAALLLAACTPQPAPKVIDAAPSYRDQGTPIGVTSRFDESKFGGLWYLRGYLPEAEKFDEVAFRMEGGKPAFRLAAFVCDPAGICGNFAEDLATRRVGKGRYVIKMLNGSDRNLWVLWVDEGFRTAVIGNPEGTFAWVLDRAKTGGADRLKAAREILDFNGYNVRQLKVK